MVDDIVRYDVTTFMFASLTTPHSANIILRSGKDGFVRHSCIRELQMPYFSSDMHIRGCMHKLFIPHSSSSSMHIVYRYFQTPQSWISYSFPQLAKILTFVAASMYLLILVVRTCIYHPWSNPFFSIYNSSRSHFSCSEIPNSFSCVNNCAGTSRQQRPAVLWYYLMAAL